MSAANEKPKLPEPPMADKPKPDSDRHEKAVNELRSRVDELSNRVEAVEIKLRTIVNR